MHTQCDYGFIGAGNMAGAIIGGILAKELASPAQIGVCDLDSLKTTAFAERGCRVFAGTAELCAACKFVFLAVKPQSFGAVMPEVRSGISPDTVLVSIAAGITADYIKREAGFDCKVVLAMPNTPLLLGQGAVALSRVDPTTSEEFARIKALFEASGVAEEIPSGKMNEIIPVNGSSPAFVYLLAKTLTDCAGQAGIAPDQALRLVCQTLIGSAHMLRDSGKTAAELIEMVCSPGGTTLAALQAMEQNGFSDSIKKGFSACVDRARELAGN